MNSRKRGAGDCLSGIDYQEQELVEISFVTVPANPAALFEPPRPWL
ncbi:MAG: hypothetical protein J2P48_01210 [Alphaproteobacteria bacterium]|nr:hypothetical protein [Alphaproteobacteria bacterium]